MISAMESISHFGLLKFKLLYCFSQNIINLANNAINLTLGIYLRKIDNLDFNNFILKLSICS